MVKRLYPLIALFGLAFMVTGVVYIAMAQDGGESNPSAPVEESPTPSSTLTWTPSPTLTWTPEPTATLVPTDVPPTVEPPTVVPPTEVLQPTVEQPTVPAEPALQETLVDPNQLAEITPTMMVEATQPVEATPTVVVEITQPVEAAPTVVVEITQPVEAAPTVVVEITQPVEPTPIADTNQPAAPPVIEAPTEVMPSATPVLVDNGQSNSGSVPEIGVASPTPVLVVPTEITPAATLVPATVQPTEMIAPTLTVTEILPASTLTPMIEFTPTLAFTEVVATVTPIIEITPTVVTDPVIEVTAEATAEPELTATPDPALAANITGLINYQQMQDHSGIQLSLMLPDGSVVSAVSDAAGTFNFTNLQPGVYILQAAAQGYLSSQLELTLEAGQQLDLPPAILHLGDTNQDNLIDLSDAMLIAANFDAAVIVPETDLNGDGWIDIRDLSLVGAQFGLIGPLPWN